MVQAKKTGTGALKLASELTGRAEILDGMVEVRQALDLGWKDYLSLASKGINRWSCSRGDNRWR
jgi:hypothetical protein